MTSKYLKIMTYNVNGLPGTIDLSTLPWVLRPLAWLYRLFKKSYVVSLGGTQEGNIERAKKISHYLDVSDADIIAVQEDFNYHSELCSRLGGYGTGCHLGGFHLPKLFSTTEWWSYFPFPRFKADGLSIFTKSSRVEITNEHIVRWDKSYGYISHANDLMTHKGFRLYELTVDGDLQIDVYIVHMDADFYDKETCPDVQGDIIARRTQLTQLTNFIMDRKDNCNYRPVIIMGDTNCSPNNEWDVENINDYLLTPFRKYIWTYILEAIPTGFCDVDRLFIINDIRSKAHVSVSHCGYDTNTKLSDHKPFSATLRIDL